jgi:competence ComEA-like helix-hairpin-helix protein
MNIGDRSVPRRCTRTSPFWAAKVASIAVLALLVLVAAVNAQQGSVPKQAKTQQSAEASGKAAQKQGTSQPAKTGQEQPSAQSANGQSPAATTGSQDPAQGGSQQPFVMPDKPMCPCPLLTKDPVEPHFQEICGRCHTPDRITGTRKSGLEWKETIDKMILKGAQVSDDDYDVILAFLVRNFDRVDINWVESGELVVALGLTNEEAEKIVAYRKEHGDFKDFETLAKVPGVDAKKLEAKKSTIVFQ